MSQHIYENSEGTSTKKGLKSVEKHFDHFYKEVFLKKQEFSSKRTELTFKNITYNKISDELIGHFANYLTVATKLDGKNEKDTLSYPTISQYFSAMKQHLLFRFSSEKTPISFQDSKFKHYKDEMRKIKVWEALSKNKPLFGEFLGATCDDAKALAATILWGGNTLDAEFLALFLTCITNCGRGSEVCFFYSKIYDKFISKIL